MSGMTVPVIPALPAGHVVTLTDMQALAGAAAFLLGKPLCQVRDDGGGLSIATTAAGTAVSFSTAIFDPDLMYSAAAPTRLTVQTPGWYRARYAVNCGTAGNVFLTWLKVVGGPANPTGSGVSQGSFWYGYTDTPTASPGWAGAAGTLPVYMYAGDWVEVHVRAASAGASTGTTAPGGATLGGSWLRLEYVST